MKLLACAVAAMTLVAGAAQAGDWRSVNTSEAAAEFLNIETVRALQNNKKLIWGAYAWSMSRDGGDYIIFQKEIDCVRVTEKLLSAHIYDRNDKVLRYGSVDEPATPLVPDSNGYSMFEIVCENSAYGTSSFVNMRQAVNRFRSYLSEGN